MDLHWASERSGSVEVSEEASEPQAAASWKGSYRAFLHCSSSDAQLLGFHIIKPLYGTLTGLLGPTVDPGKDPVDGNPMIGMLRKNRALG